MIAVFGLTATVAPRTNDVTLGESLVFRKRIGASQKLRDIHYLPYFMNANSFYHLFMRV